MILPISHTWTRAHQAKDESDSAYFHELLLVGEVILKSIVAALVAALGDDSDRTRYSHLYRLVRADGIGDWASCAVGIAGGSAVHLLPYDAQSLVRELTEKVNRDDWRHEAVSELHRAYSIVHDGVEPLPGKVDLKRWFTVFAELRNKTRGHGATTLSQSASSVPKLERSFRLLSTHSQFFKLQWAALHRNLSGKYRVVPLSAEAGASSFDVLKGSRDQVLQNGVYVFVDRPRWVELMTSSPDLDDFFYANGAFKERTYELLSYKSNVRRKGDGTSYLLETSSLPSSETEGLVRLEQRGRTFTNLPQVPLNYVSRCDLEKELVDVLTNERHPVVTLVGRGGTGKTSLALSVLDRITSLDCFSAVLWFSARDVDLLTEGPRPVRPSTVTITDWAKQFASLLQPAQASERTFDPLSYLSEYLSTTPIGRVAFVLDNFETVDNPLELYRWLDCRVRPPNKVLITTRHHEFKGDYSVEVKGMTEPEAETLMLSTARSLGSANLFDKKYRSEIYHESSGHPYVIRILVGEAVKADRRVKVERILESQDGILDALFERTFLRLSPASRRILLTLAAWRSLVPVVALEACMLRPENERVEVRMCLDELRMFSLIELHESDAGKSTFASVPLATALFCRRKMRLSEFELAVEDDLRFLQLFGAMQASDLRHGLAPRIERFARAVGAIVSKEPSSIEKWAGIIEFIARRHASAWLLLADLFEEFGGNDSLVKARGAVTRFIEQTTNSERQEQGWLRLSSICRRLGDWRCIAKCIVQISNLASADLATLSDVANELNGIFVRIDSDLSLQEKRDLARRIIQGLSASYADLNATDLSRLAWLYVHVGETEQAAEAVKLGLSVDPHNRFCIKLAQKLLIGQSELLDRE